MRLCCLDLARRFWNQFCRCVSTGAGAADAVRGAYIDFLLRQAQLEGVLSLLLCRRPGRVRVVLFEDLGLLRCQAGTTGAVGLVRPLGASRRRHGRIGGRAWVGRRSVLLGRARHLRGRERLTVDVVVWQMFQSGTRAAERVSEEVRAIEVGAVSNRGTIFDEVEAGGIAEEPKVRRLPIIVDIGIEEGHWAGRIRSEARPGRRELAGEMSKRKRAASARCVRASARKISR